MCYATPHALLILKVSLHQSLLTTGNWHTFLKKYVLIWFVDLFPRVAGRVDSDAGKLWLSPPKGSPLLKVTWGEEWKDKDMRRTLPGSFCLQEGESISCGQKKLSFGPPGHRTSSRGHSHCHLPAWHITCHAPQALHSWGSCRSQGDRVGEQIINGPSILWRRDKIRFLYSWDQT